MEQLDSLPSSVYVVVLAGGRGTRLWPLSRPERPKQFLALEGGTETMLQVTLRRARRLVADEHILVVGDREHAALLRAQVGQAHLLLEPTGRNTAAAVTFAATLLRREAPEAVMAVLSADHVILNEDHWLQVMRAALLHAHESEDFVTVGTAPTTSERRYGYMVTSGIKRRMGSLDVLEVARFAEKPDPVTLDSLISSGACLRNMGMFAWRAATLLAEVDRHLPVLGGRVRDWLAKGAPTENDGVPTRFYEGLPSVSVDEGILQGADHVAVVSSVIDRVDVGDFSAFADLWPLDADGNAVHGHVVASDAHNNIVYTDDAEIAVVGVDDLVIVCDGRSVLICPKSRTQDIKRLVEDRREREHT